MAQPPFTTRPELRGRFGAISSTHWIASAAGMAVLERGGNAFDAAAAAGFVLQIVEPHLVGPGGEVPIILKRADAEAPIVICGQGPYPAGATLAHFTAQGLEQVPGTGLLPAVVPGAFDAWMLLLRDHGTWRLADVLAYAIHYAETGFPVLPRIAAAILAAKDFFAAEWPTSAEIWCPRGAVPAPGTFYATPRTAATYRRIIAEAESAGGDRVAQIERARRLRERCRGLPATIESAGPAHAQAPAPARVAGIAATGRWTLDEAVAR
jgi:gamma-glutamyltranspeptidase/glutathione hydrolase